jgi:hypothetical protein
MPTIEYEKGFNVNSRVCPYTRCHAPPDKFDRDKHELDNSALFCGGILFARFFQIEETSHTRQIKKKYPINRDMSIVRYPHIANAPVMR